jgi:hypothetical protein
MIADRSIDQAYSDLKEVCGGSHNDYFGLLYLEREHGLLREKARNQVAFGGNDYGLDGFHLDPERRNLYLFQFKYSAAYSQFKDSLQRLIDRQSAIPAGTYAEIRIDRFPEKRNLHVC